jgi:2'-5' RNA ligase
MHGLVSLLSQPYYDQVNALWQGLEEKFHLRGIQVTPYPHFSWQIAQDYDFDRMEAILQKIAAQTHPFDARTTGIGMFTGPRPVIYIPVVKSLELMQFHSQVWEKTLPASQGLSSYYAPPSWVPHISLAYEDVEKANIASVIEYLAFHPYNWEMKVDNIALIYEPSGETGKLKYHFKFA